MSQKDESKPDTQNGELEQIEHLSEQLKKFSDSYKQRNIANATELNQRRQNRLSDETEMATFIDDCLKLDSWLLYSEALAVCQNWEPANDIRGEFARTPWAVEVKKHMEAAKYTSLPILNPQDKAAKWRVKPKAFIAWLDNQGLSPIDHVNDALQHLLKKTAKASSNPSTNGYTERHAAKREAVLSAALAVLATYPEQCHVNGKVSATAIVRQIEEKAPLWFGHEDLPLASRTMTELINKALKTTLSE